MKPSPNFEFLDAHDQQLVRFATWSERLVFQDPNTSLIKLRQFAELLAEHSAAYAGLRLGLQARFADVLVQLERRDVTDRATSRLFHGLRQAGNAAVHEGTGDQRDALHQLKMARRLGVWFHRVFGGQPGFSPGPFIPPPAPGKSSQALAAELARLQDQLQIAVQDASDSAQLRMDLQRRMATIQENADAALELAEQTEVELTQVRARLQQRPPLDEDALWTALAQVDLELDEGELRREVDLQLRAAGWDADSDTLSHAQGARPVHGRNQAIGGWPGGADWVLFVGETPVAAVEVEPTGLDVAHGLLKLITFSKETDLRSADGPIRGFGVPLLLQTTGDGIWALDARRPTLGVQVLERWPRPQDG
jgi:type I restriction enzyme R subunit